MAIVANLQGIDLPHLRRHEQWSLASLVDHNSQLRYNPNEASPAVQQAQVAEALRSIPIPDPGVTYTLREVSPYLTAVLQDSILVPMKHQGPDLQHHLQ